MMKEARSKPTVSPTSGKIKAWITSSDLFATSSLIESATSPSFLHKKVTLFQSAESRPKRQDDNIYLIILRCV
jgi:hypothetical protein